MPICSRCFGMIIGITIGSVASIFVALNTRWYGVVFIIPALVDVFLQERGIRNSNNLIRLATGFLAGIGIGIFIFLWIKDDLNYILNYIT